MKSTLKLITFLVATTSVLCLSACVTSTTTSTAPDGTITVTKNTAPDANSLLSLNILTETWGNTRGVNRNSGK